MNIFGRLKNAIAKKAESKVVDQFDTQAEAEALIRSTLQGAASGADSSSAKWAKGIAVAFFGGLAGAGALLLNNPDQLFQPNGPAKFCVTALGMGMVAVSLYLKASPLPPAVKTDNVEHLGNGLIRIVEPGVKPITPKESL